MTQKTFSGGLFTITCNNSSSYIYLGLYCRHPACLHNRAFANAPCQYIISPWIESKIETCYYNSGHVLLLPEHLQSLKNLLSVVKDTTEVKYQAIKTYLQSIGYIFLPEEEIKDIVLDRFRASHCYDFVKISEMQSWSNFSRYKKYLKDKYILLKIESHKKKMDGELLTLLNLGHVHLSSYISDQLKIKQNSIFEPTSLNIKSVKLPDPLKFKPLGIYY